MSENKCILNFTLETTSTRYSVRAMSMNVGLFQPIQQWWTDEYIKLSHNDMVYITIYLSTSLQLRC